MTLDAESRAWHAELTALTAPRFSVYTEGRFTRGVLDRLERRYYPFPTRAIATRNAALFTADPSYTRRFFTGVAPKGALA